MRDARRRTAKAILRDPLFWCSLVVVAFTGIRALNTGIGLGYDAESASWHVSSSMFPILPGVVDAAGDLPFAASVAFAVLLQACRHSLGRSARAVFLLAASSLSGLTAIAVLVAVHEGSSMSFALLPSSAGTCFSFFGFAFGLYLVAGLVSLVTSFEQGWNMAFLLLLLSIGGNAAGLFVFAPPYLSAGFAAVGLVVLLYILVFSCVAAPKTCGLRAMFLGGLSLAFGGLLVFVLLPEADRSALLASYADLKLFPARFWEMRESLSAISFKSWTSNLWIGTGLKSFPLDFRFNALEADWMLLPGGASTMPNGWRLLLAERGIVGLAFFALPFGFLFFTYVHRLIGGMADWELAHPVCLVAPAACAIFVAAGFFDCSPLRVEVVMAMGALLAVSAAALPSAKRGKNG